MDNDQKLEAKFWKALKSDMTLMLGLANAEQAHTRPMTAQLVDDASHGPIWFFSSKESHLVRDLGAGRPAVANFASKNHDVFACIHGVLTLDNDRAVIDQLWNRYVAAWYEGGKDDPKLALLRLDLDEGEIWENASSLIAGIKMMLGADPKKDYKDKVAKVQLA